MALRVPTPELQGPARLGGIRTVAAETPFQNLRMPDTSFNARMMQQLGDSGVKLAGYLQEQEDERLLLEFQSGLGDWERETLYGEGPDGAPSTKKSGAVGILSREEKDAFGVTDEVEQALTQKLSEMNGSLSGLSRSGQMAARELVQRRREALLNQVARYEFQQRDAYNRKLRAQAEAAAKRAAETAWATPEAMAAGLSRVTSAATTRASHEYAALPEQERKERIDADVAAAVDEFYRTAIMRAVGQGQPKIGRELYEQAVAEGKITLEDDDLLTRTVQYGEQIDVVVNGATALYEQFPKDLGAAVDAARSMGLDGDTERSLVTELQRRYTLAAAVEAQQREQMFEAARKAALDGELFEQFDASQRAQFTPAERADLEALNSNAAVVGDTALVREVLQYSAEELATYDLNAVVGRLTPKQWDTLLAARSAARRELAEGSDYEWNGIRTEQVTIDTTITAMGVEPDAVEERNAVWLLIQAERDRRIAAGESWTPRDIQAYADVLNSKVPVEEGWVYGYNTTELWRILSGKKPVAFPVPGVPTDAVEQIGRLLAEEGTPVTPENIRAVYDRAVAAAGKK